MRFLWRTAALVVALLGFCEGVARLMNPDAPLLPYSTEGGYPSLPASSRLRVALTPGAPVEYVTDSFGARIDGTSHTTAEPEVLIVGDSQALGYDLPFEKTAAAHIGACAPERGVAISAAPASDLEDYLLRMARESRSRLALRRVILILNLGNDLDEAYSSGQWFRGPSVQRLPTWLVQYSRVYQWLVLQIQERDLSRTSVPGVNRILYELSVDERVALVEATATRLVDSLRSMPTQRILVVVIPSDVDVDQAELRKYKRYSTGSAFESWLTKADAFSNQLAALRRLLVSRLQSARIDVIDLHEVFDAHDAQSVYSRTSHHLTTLGNELAAGRICMQFGNNR